METSQESIVVVGTLISVSFIILVGFLVFLVVNNYRRNVKRKSELANSILATQEEERLRIARDIHDEMGPMLTSIKLKLANMGSNHIEVNDTMVDLDTTINQMRGIIKDLNSNNIKNIGLMDALKQFIGSLECDAEISCTSTIEDANLLSPIQKHHLYRMAIELTNNSVKYAQSNKIEVEFNIRKNRVALMHRDYGIGFDIDNVKPTSTGISNIKERVAFLDGYIYCKSEQNKGTLFYIEVPIN